MPPRPIGAELTTNPLVRMVTFTGSTDTGREVVKASGISAEADALLLLQQLVLAGHLLVTPASASGGVFAAGASRRSTVGLGRSRETPPG